eukprot:COSAG01_NODE_735_length_13969_cov_357.018241_6_plen_337_part_00
MPRVFYTLVCAIPAWMAQSPPPPAPEPGRAAHHTLWMAQSPPPPAPEPGRAAHHTLWSTVGGFAKGNTAECTVADCVDCTDLECVAAESLEGAGHPGAAPPWSTARRICGAVRMPADDSLLPPSWSDGSGDDASGKRRAGTARSCTVDCGAYWRLLGTCRDARLVAGFVVAHLLCACADLAQELGRGADAGLVGDALRRLGTSVVLVGVLRMMKAAGTQVSYREFTFGFARGEVIGSFALAVLVIFHGLYHGVEAIQRLLDPLHGHAAAGERSTPQGQQGATGLLDTPELLGLALSAAATASFRPYSLVRPSSSPQPTITSHIQRLSPLSTPPNAL